MQESEKKAVWYTNPSQVSNLPEQDKKSYMEEIEKYKKKQKSDDPIAGSHLS